MSLSTTTNRSDRTLNGVATVFAFDFKVFAETDLEVIHIDQTTEVETVLTLGVDYTVSGVNADAGSVTLVAGPGTSGDRLIIKRVMNLVQPTRLRNQGDFFPATHERAFDRSIMIDQQQQEEIDRSFKLSKGASGGVTATPVPGFALGFDALGNLGVVPNTGADQTAAWTAADAVVAADAAAATALVRADLASSATGKGAALVSFHNGPLNVGNRDGATNSSDPVILASRTVDDSVVGNGHCFSDSSIVTRGGTMAYASYDARFTVTGTQPYNHFAPFQNGMVYGSSGALGYMYGYVDAPSMSNGAVTYRLGIRINDVVKTGGTIGTNAGIWIENLTAGSNNYPIRQVGSNQCWFDGSIKLDGGLVLGTGPATKPIDSTGVGVSTFTGPITCGGLTLSATLGNSGEIGKSGSSGLRLTAVAGSSYDFSVLSPGNAAFIMTVATGTTGVKFGGTVGFNATNPIAKPTVTGSRGGNAALASLLTALANYGLITDSSTA